jgi:hypothetical protein
MEPISRASITEFLTRLGEQFPSKASFYLLGGSALCLLGSPRETLDIDYTTDLDPNNYSSTPWIRVCDFYKKPNKGFY